MKTDNERRNDIVVKTDQLMNETNEAMTELILNWQY